MKTRGSWIHTLPYEEFRDALGMASYEKITSLSINENGVIIIETEDNRPVKETEPPGTK